jgi:hypothetical protein
MSFMFKRDEKLGLQPENLEHNIKILIYLFL